MPVLSISKLEMIKYTSRLLSQETASGKSIYHPSGRVYRRYRLHGAADNHPTEAFAKDNFGTHLAASVREVLTDHHMRDSYSIRAFTREDKTTGQAHSHRYTCAGP